MAQDKEQERLCFFKPSKHHQKAPAHLPYIEQKLPSGRGFMLELL